MKPGILQRFTEAILSRDVRKVMPTDMSSAELAQLGADVLERGVFSARTLSTQYLNAMEGEIRDLLEPKTVRTEDGGLRTDGTNQASARLELKKVWEALGYEAPQGKEGTLQDLSSDARIDLVLETNVDMARGYGQWRQGQEEETLDVFPCAELFRAEEREQKRDWISRWREAARAVGDADALKALPRMIARKDSPIWEELSRFGTPYPPFDFNSGMWVRDVDREEAEALGVIGFFDRVTPQRRSFEVGKEAA